MTVGATTAAATTAPVLIAPVDEFKEFGALIEELRTGAISPGNPRLRELANKHCYDVVSWAYSAPDPFYTEENAAWGGYRENPDEIRRSIQSIETARKRVFLKHLDTIIPDKRERLGGLLAAWGGHTIYLVQPGGKDIESRMEALLKEVGKDMTELPAVGWERMRSGMRNVYHENLPQFFVRYNVPSFGFRTHLIHTKPGAAHRVINIEPQIAKMESLMSQLLRGEIKATHPELNELATNFGDAMIGLEGLFEFQDSKEPDIITLRKKFTHLFAR